MTAYLQRLYDAGGAYTAMDARPAQVSSSPLLAVDQRLASPGFAASFLLGLPGEGDSDPGPSPEPDLLVQPARPLRDAERAAGEVVRAPSPRPAPVAGPTPPSGPLPERPEAVAPLPAAPPEAWSPPDLTSFEPVARRPATEHPVELPDRRPSRLPEVPQLRRPADPPRVDAPTVAPDATGAPRPSVPDAEPFRPRRTRSSQTAAETAAPLTDHRPATETRSRPPLLHPAPVPLPDPLPPASVASPPVAPGELAEQVHRLVREAMGSQPTRPDASRDRGPGRTGEKSPRVASSPRTAEAMSVIGPLDRPARATTLYGLRLR